MNDLQTLRRGAPALPVSGHTAPVLSVRDLTTSFHTRGGWTSVARDVSFDISPGETLAIVGESGSGKSVTSMAIMGLLPHGTSRAEGRVRLEGREILNLQERDMQRIRGNQISMVFQEPMTSLNPVYTIGDQLAETLRARRRLSRSDARNAVRELLDQVRIPNAERRIDEYPHQMSGGMRQRVMLAMALAARPKVLIADEPTTALDVTIQREILELISDLQMEIDMGVLFITHDMGVVAEIADRTLVMYRGDVVEQGATTEIFAAPRERYTRDLLAAVPRLGDMSGKPGPQRFSVADPASDVSRQAIGAQGPILEVTDLSVHFPIRGGMLRRSPGAVHAVENVSFSLAAGETLSIVGESGCGKSTTGRALLRLTEPTSGQVKIDGTDMGGLSREALRETRRRAQMIFQDPYSSLNPRSTIGEALVEPFVAHAIGTVADGERKARGLLDRVGLQPDAMGRYPHEFSGGQRQRAAIARALMLDPRIIIADEAVSALDVSVKAQVCDLLLDLQESLGLSYVFISHDMAIVERVSHRVAVMYLGEIVEIGSRAQVFETPGHPYTRRLLDAVPRPDPALRGTRPPIETRELKSPIRAPGFQAPKRLWSELAPGHLVVAEG